MVDEAHDWTDERIAEVEAILVSLYSNAKSRIRECISEAFEAIDNDYESGGIEAQELALGMPDDLVAEIAEIATSTDVEAVQTVTDRADDIYRRNAGYILLLLLGTAEVSSGMSKRLRSMPHVTSIDRGKDFAWNMRRMASAIKAIDAKSRPSEQSAAAASRVMDMDMRFAMRTARTAATRAEALGRLTAMQELVRGGARIEKEWVAVMDGRTRKTHAELDGTHAPVDEPFVTSSGAKLMYPADPDCDDASEVYNCRCTLRPWGGVR